jgi:hypothetical protein
MDIAPCIPHMEDVVVFACDFLDYMHRPIAATVTSLVARSASVCLHGRTFGHVIRSDAHGL